MLENNFPTMLVKSDCEPVRTGGLVVRKEIDSILDLILREEVTKRVEVHLIHNNPVPIKVDGMALPFAHDALKVIEDEVCRFLSCKLKRHPDKR
jgi:hypothetical protein